MAQQRAAGKGWSAMNPLTDDRQVEQCLAVTDGPRAPSGAPSGAPTRAPSGAPSGAPGPRAEWRPVPARRNANASRVQRALADFLPLGLSTEWRSPVTTHNRFERIAEDDGDRMCALREVAPTDIIGAVGDRLENRQLIKCMVDSGASGGFIRSREAAITGLRLMAIPEDQCGRGWQDASGNPVHQKHMVDIAFEANDAQQKRIKLRTSNQVKQAMSSVSLDNNYVAALLCPWHLL